MILNKHLMIFLLWLSFTIVLSEVAASAGASDGVIEGLLIASEEKEATAIAPVLKMEIIEITDKCQVIGLSGKVVRFNHITEEYGELKVHDRIINEDVIYLTDNTSLTISDNGRTLKFESKNAQRILKFLEGS